MSNLEENTKVRVIIESCLGKGTKQDQADKIIKTLKEKSFYIVNKNFTKLYTISENLINIIESAVVAAEDLEKFDIDDYSCQ